MKKTLGIILLAIIAVGGLGIAIASANAESPSKNNSEGNLSWGWGPIATLMQRSWVRLDGAITMYGPDKVNGSLSVLAGTKTSLDDNQISDAASATAMWNITINRKNGNFTTNFFEARMVKSNVTVLNYQGNDLFMNGTWNVYNVTITSTVITSGDLSSEYIKNRQTNTDIKNLANNAYGELNVTDSWAKFTLSINGINPLSGTVHRSLTRQLAFNRFQVSDIVTNKVTKADLTSVAEAYGATPGMANYDQKLDFNLHYKIDITDLATVAANVQH